MKSQKRTSKKETKPGLKISDLRPVKDAKGGGEIVVTKPIDKSTGRIP